MLDLKSRVTYLQGLAEGLGIDEATKEGKILTELIHVLRDLADSVEDVLMGQDELEEYIEDVDHDLACLEDEVYDEADEEQTVVEITCPKCGEVISFAGGDVDDMDNIEVICPNCGELVYDGDDGFVYTEDDDRIVDRPGANN